jgi:hypothetical protein
LHADENMMVPHRHWPAHVIESFVDKVRAHQVPGFKGHAVSEEGISALPDPALMFVAAAKGVHSESGVKAGLFKAYVPDMNNNRQLAKLGMFNFISPSTISKTRPEVAQDGQEVLFVEQANLLSLDPVRPFMQGIPGAVKIASEGASMLKPEEIKLISELGLEDLREHNPKLIAALTAEAAKTTVSPDSTALLDKAQKLIQENAKLQMENVVATEVAKALDCNVDDLPKHITGLLKIQESAVTATLAAELGKIEKKPLRDAVAKQLEGSKFTSVDEVKPAVESAINTVKSIVTAMGANLGAIGDNSSNFSTENSVASKDMRRIMEVANG